jgi:hypothetical protein
MKLYGLEINGEVVDTAGLPQVLRDLIPEYVKEEVERQTEAPPKGWFRKRKKPVDIRIRIVEINPKVKRQYTE